MQWLRVRECTDPTAREPWHRALPRDDRL